MGLQTINQTLITITNGFNSSFSGDFWLTRFIFCRALGGIYFIAFLSLFNQYKGLISSKGLLPAHIFVDYLWQKNPNLYSLFFKIPSLFLINTSDAFLFVMAISGLLLSFAVMMGLSNGLSFLLLWIIYMSFVNIGQAFYSFGWESLLLETGFLAIFIYPFMNLDFFPAHHKPPKIIFLMIVWILFRNMFGAGLIKLRGDDSWKNLTSLFYHFETQPIPNPLSPFFHRLPKFLLKFGVLFNHFVELIIPFLLFGPRKTRIIAGIFIAVFQSTLILSGNLSWLNWLTLVLCIACFDDSLWKKLFTENFLSKIPLETTYYTTNYQWLYLILSLTIIALSIRPTLNLFSKHQIMNGSFDPFRLVNTYGAFGSVGKERFEIVISGTYDTIIGSDTKWLEYEFKAKPGKISKCPPITAPYHYRLDWHIWFAAMSSYDRHPWLVHLIYKLLNNDKYALNLINHNPFTDIPPSYIKLDLYRYEFADKESKHWWKREFMRSYIPPLQRKDPSLLNFLKSYRYI